MLLGSCVPLRVHQGGIIRVTGLEQRTPGLRFADDPDDDPRKVIILPTAPVAVVALQHHASFNIEADDAIGTVAKPLGVGLCPGMSLVALHLMPLQRRLVEQRRAATGGALLSLMNNPG